jgi:sugar phosphate permease
MKKIFFGWFIVAAALLLMTYNSVLFVYGFTAFMDPIVATFSWGYAQISFASSLRGLETGSLDPLVGIAADRWPARRLMFIGITIYALGAICISRATNLAMFYAGFLIVGLGGAIGTTMVPTTVIARWFKKNIGKASGFLSTGVAIGGIFAPLIVKAIDTFTWQNTLMYLAFGMLIMGIPLSFLFRDRPEEYGLLPDGEKQTDAEIPETHASGVGVREALKMRAFWCIGIATMLQMTAIHGLTIHMMPYLTSIEIERSSAAIAVTVFSIITIVSRIVYGFLADIFNKKNVIALSMLLTAIGLVMFQLLDGSSFAMVILFAVVYGIGAAGAMPLRTPIIREYFGVRKFGTIFGMLAFFLTIGSAAGAPLAGWVYDTRGVYDPIWYIYAGINVVGILLILIMRPSDNQSGPRAI